VTSSDEPQSAPSGKQPRVFRESSGPLPTGDPDPDDARTGIIRRHPTGPLPEPLSDDTRTSSFRREQASLEPGAQDELATGFIRKAPVRIPGPPALPANTTAVAASAVGIVSGWATSVVATDLITAWWQTDRLFCIGMGFLTAVFGTSAIAGVVGLLLRRRVGIFLSVVAAVLAMLIFAGIFVAGAQMAGVVYALPALPAATVLLAVAPATWRWTG
jgi:hypothetical protein